MLPEHTFLPTADRAKGDRRFKKIPNSHADLCQISGTGVTAVRDQVMRTKSSVPAFTELHSSPSATCLTICQSVLRVNTAA